MPPAYHFGRLDLLISAIIFSYVSYIISTFCPFNHISTPSPPNTSASITFPSSPSAITFAVGRRSRIASTDIPVYLNRIFFNFPPYINCTRFRNSPSSKRSLYGTLKCSLVIVKDWMRSIR